MRSEKSHPLGGSGERLPIGAAQELEELGFDPYNPDMIYDGLVVDGQEVTIEEYFLREYPGPYMGHGTPGRS